MGQKIFTSLLVVMVVGMLVIGGAVTYVLLKAPDTPADTKDQTSNDDCEITPTLAWSALDAITTGNSVTTTAVARVNDKYIGSVTSGTTTFTKGDKVELLLTNSTYIDTVTTPVTIKCGANQLLGNLMGKDATDVTLTIKDVNALTDNAAGGLYNVTAFAVPKTLKIELNTASDEVIDEGYFVVEASNDTQIKEITIGSSTATVEKLAQSKPYMHAFESSTNNQITRYFKVSDITDKGVLNEFSLSIEPETGLTVGAGTAVYVTFYPAQAFVDSDGTFKVGIENKDNVAKYETSRDADYDFRIV